VKRVEEGLREQCVNSAELLLKRTKLRLSKIGLKRVHEIGLKIGESKIGFQIRGKVRMGKIGF